jgi:CRP/FNR family cyclic AMP-dependent transcriptional regulator
MGMGSRQDAERLKPSPDHRHAAGGTCGRARTIALALLRAALIPIKATSIRHDETSKKLPSSWVRSMSISTTVDFRTFARSAGTVLNYASGDTIFRENDIPQFMYVVLSGSVEITSHNRQIETVNAGDVFGILSLLDEQPTPITARARERSELALINRTKCRSMVNEMPDFAWHLLLELAHRLRNTNAAI